MARLIKLNRHEIKQLSKLTDAMNELLELNNTIKIKNTIKKLNLDHEQYGHLEFDYGYNFIRIYSMSEEWRVNNDYDEIYFDLKLLKTKNDEILNKGNKYVITSNCKTPFEYIPKIVTSRLEKGVKYLADNSKEFIRKINLIVDEDRRNVALKEFLPRKYVKL